MITELRVCVQHSISFQLPNHKTHHARPPQNKLLWKACLQGHRQAMPTQQPAMPTLQIHQHGVQAGPCLAGKDKSCEDLLPLQAGELSLGRRNPVLAKALAW